MKVLKKKKLPVRRLVLLTVASAALLTISHFAVSEFFSSSAGNETAVYSVSSEVPGVDGLYPTKPVSDAYLSGDTSGLDSFDMEIYNKAAEILEDTVTSEMTDYEKELAIHDYLVLHTEYDESRLTVFEFHGENAENPYGALVEGKAVCSGYTTAFQLLMDMAEIPCKSIYAKDFKGGDHAWNMVEIEGEWYYVDVTWDDQIPEVENRPVRHKYFNVTEKYMALKHVWDTEELPEADSYDHSFVAHNLVTVSDYDSVLHEMEEQLKNNADCVYFEFDEKLGVKLEKADKPDESFDVAKICPQLEKVFSEFSERYEDYGVSAQRIEFEDRIVLAVTMIKER